MIVVLFLVWFLSRLVSSGLVWSGLVPVSYPKLKSTPSFSSYSNHVSSALQLSKGKIWIVRPASAALDFCALPPSLRRTSLVTNESPACDRLEASNSNHHHQQHQHQHQQQHHDPILGSPVAYSHIRDIRARTISYLFSSFCLSHDTHTHTHTHILHVVLSCDHA
ncbi:hypothetical protein BO99DRAFT_213364 [Aspergillus violaceofuscus CBS 115571]|uniref:Secreted protein n=1 Tax=Aspergillus violaceofuscus (strain CBS 115571) TaxID=1450538 RepID=A0A2V5HKM4_ASPV1|nr:hypothetical protein BO99DRAFT_213364 [Aspergillus violaceofuscus CBS 115571]